MKTIFSAAFSAAIAMVIGYHVYNTQQKPTMTDFELANAEALADIELTEGDWYVTFDTPNSWTCTPDGGVNCPETPW